MDYCFDSLNLISMILIVERACKYPCRYWKCNSPTFFIYSQSSSTLGLWPMLIISPTSIIKGITFSDPEGNHSCKYKRRSFAAAFFIYCQSSSKLGIVCKRKKAVISDSLLCLMWALRDSNPRPPRCKRGALNQLS